MPIVPLPRSAIVAFALLPLTFSTAALAETGVDAAQSVYYSDPLISIDRGMDKGHILARPESPDLPAASSKSIRTVAKEAGESGNKVVMEPGTGGCTGPRCGGTPEYFPDSHINLGYFPARSSYGYFPAGR